MLVVEDDPTAAEAIAAVVRTTGYAVRVAGSVIEARRVAAEDVPDLALVDQTLPDGEGTALLHELREAGVEDLVMVSAAGSRDVVVEALRAGASDFLRKPVRLSHVRRAVLGSRALQRRGPDVAASPAGATEVEPAGLVGRSRASRELRRRVERIAAIEQLRALIVGPAGTDKRRVAARLHVETGANGAALFVDCAHEIDASASLRFLGREGDPEHGVVPVQGYLARARGGTLVLDDLSCLPRALQSVLSTALSTPSAGRADGAGRSAELGCGVIGILREPARIALATGRLSSDLHLALAGAILEIPSLEDRREDVEAIAEHFLAELNEEGREDKRLSEALRVEIAERSWPGNLLQLRNTLRNAWARAESGERLELGRNTAAGETPPTPVDALIGLGFRDVRRELLQRTLEHTGGDKRLCAKLLGISLKSVYTHLERSRRPERPTVRARPATPMKRPAKPVREKIDRTAGVRTDPDRDDRTEG